MSIILLVLSKVKSNEDEPLQLDDRHFFEV
jgi:hypothetical protein